MPGLHGLSKPQLLYITSRNYFKDPPVKDGSKDKEVKIIDNLIELDYNFEANRLVSS